MTGPGDGTAGDEPIFLARLLAMAFRDLIDRLHEELVERGWTVRPAYGFVMLALRHRPSTPGEIAALLGVTKQAASKLVESLGENGLVDVEPAADDRRVRRVTLTEEGRRFLTAVEEIYAQLEDEWAAIVGRRRLERLRADLTTVLVSTHDGVLPAVRPTW